nr:Extracellular solute-binding protein family 3 [uncultured bacterium]
MIKISKPSYLKCVFGILGALLVTGCQNTQKDPNTIQVGICSDYPPFESRNDQNELVGYDVDLARIIGKELGKKVNFVDMSFNALLSSVQSGKIDMVISSVGITEEREKQVDFSDPYFFNRLTVVSRKEMPLLDENALKGKKIGVQLGSSFAHWAKIRNLKNVATMDLNPQLIEALKTRQIEGVIIDYTQAAIFCKKNANLVYHFLTHDEKGTAVVLKKGSTLRTLINQILQRLKSSGQLKTLESQWLR